MPNLKKREIIIVSIAVIMVLYAVYVYFIAGRLPGKKNVQTGAATVKIESVTGGFTAELGNNKLSELDNYIIKRATVDWGKNPFLAKDLYRAWLAKDGGGGSFKIIYSGYVDSEKYKMAVLNNVEYRVGEELKEEGYILKLITPLKVIIYDKRAESNLEIFIQE